MEEINIEIENEYIQLDQLLKLASFVPTGGQVRFLLDEHMITINGKEAFEKRKKIRPNDVVTVREMGTIRVVKK